MDNRKYIHNCRICGLYCDSPPWGDDGISPSFDYCPCCGVEFGYQDCNLKSIQVFRDKWLKNGANWKEPEAKPSAWSLQTQMKNIPEMFKIL